MHNAAANSGLAYKSCYVGPSEPPIGRLRGLFRSRILVQAEASVNLSKYMAVWRKKIRVPSRYKLHIDIDPQSFM